MVDKKNVQTIIILYILAFLFLLSISYRLEYPVGDEFAYVKQARLLLEGKTQPNWLLSTSYLTMLLGMPIIKYAFSFFGLRLLMMVIAATAAPLMYLILREVNAKKDIAVLGAFVLITNPFVALYLRQYITEPVSTPLYLLSVLFLVKGIKTGKDNLLVLGSIFAALGFFNKQFDIIPSIAALLFVFLNGYFKKGFLIKNFGINNLQITNNGMKILILSIPLICVTFYFLNNFVTTGNFINLTTVPSTVSPNAPYAPQFGINFRHNSFRILQDAIYLGFFFLPFSFYLRKFVKPVTNVLNFNIPTAEKIILLCSVLLAVLAVLSGKDFIVDSGNLLVFLAALLFSYSGLTIGLFIFQNKTSSAILNFSFIALVGCILFTVLKINIFLLKYYIIFLPFILIYLTSVIRSRMPFLLTILLLGTFGVLLSLNDVQHYEKVWSEVSKLLDSGANPSDFQGHPTVVSWLTDLVDNIHGKYFIVIKNQQVLVDFIDIDAIQILKQNS